MKTRAAMEKYYFTLSVVSYYYDSSLGLDIQIDMAYGMLDITPTKKTCSENIKHVENIKVKNKIHKI